MCELFFLSAHVGQNKHRRECVLTLLLFVEGKLFLTWVEVGDLVVTAGDFLLFLMADVE